MTREALDGLKGYDFPGNVRELELVVRQAALLCQDGVITIEDLPERIREGQATAPTAAADVGSGGDAGDLYERVVSGGEDFWCSVRTPFLRRELSRRPIQDLIARALSEAGGSYSGVARLFRIEDDYRKFVDFLRHNQLRPDDR